MAKAGGGRPRQSGLPWNIIAILWAKFPEHMRRRKLFLLRCWFVLAGVSAPTAYRHDALDILGGICVGLACIALFPDRRKTRDAARLGRDATWKVRRRRVVHAGWLPMLVLASALRAQDAGASEPYPPSSVAEKWDFFNTETVAPFTLGAGAFNAAVSQVTRSTPLYGRHPWPAAYPERFGASVGDIVSQNFFGDFVLASAFHEDTRYRRQGPSHRLWPRIGYAITRSIVTRTDSGGAEFNSANVLGTGMSAALSNAYYPPGSRNAHDFAMNWATSVAGSGLANLMPEFGPDFRRWVKHIFPLKRGKKHPDDSLFTDLSTNAVEQTAPTGGAAQ